jgi:hypothetical protein
MPFRFWTFDHWINFFVFVLGAVITGAGITASTHWGDIPALLTPVVVIGFLITVGGFLRAAQTTAARDPKLGTRESDPLPTAPIMQVGPNTVAPVPPVTPGRPVEPEKETR